MGASESPVCIAIVLCNECIEDKRTNNKSLIGLFNAINADQVPVVHNRFVVLTSITNASSVLPIRISIRAPSGTEIAHIEVDFPAEHPLLVYDIVFEFNGTVLPEFGSYDIILLSGGTYLSGRRFDVVQVQ